PAVPAAATGAASTAAAVGGAGVAAGGSTVGSDCVWVRPWGGVGLLGSGATVLPGSDLGLAAAPLLVAVVTRASLTVCVGVAVSSRLRITRRAGRTEVATTTLAGGATATTGWTAAMAAGWGVWRRQW